MPKENLTYEDVLRIVELVKSTRFSEFRLKVGEIEVHLKRRNGAAADAPLQMPAAAPGQSIAPAAQPAGERTFPPEAVLVRSPMVGTFYRAPSPGAAPFVEVGQRVDPGATLCIIEVMKLMNTIAAEARGIVTEILVENGARVEAGQVLMVMGADPEDG